mmetsp:Transcript_62420/g.148972  ORF Transcript_62420/g.148972 Transcript_62420/m.148972 type:complete len:280 (-) Transcript_62420:3906-4745(-)
MLLGESAPFHEDHQMRKLAWRVYESAGVLRIGWHPWLTIAPQKPTRKTRHKTMLTRWRRHWRMRSTLLGIRLMTGQKPLLWPRRSCERPRRTWHRCLNRQVTILMLTMRRTLSTCSSRPQICRRKRYDCDWLTTMSSCTHLEEHLRGQRSRRTRSSSKLKRTRRRCMWMLPHLSLHLQLHLVLRHLCRQAQKAPARMVRMSSGTATSWDPSPCHPSLQVWLSMEGPPPQRLMQRQRRRIHKTHQSPDQIRLQSTHCYRSPLLCHPSQMLRTEQMWPVRL